MGRLGFNLVREKDAAKNVESGLPPSDAQQNERNEGAEIGELILVCERNRRTIRSLRILSFCLAVMLMCMAAYMILTQSKNHNEPMSDPCDYVYPPTALPAVQGALMGNGLYEDAAADARQSEQANCTNRVWELEATRVELEHKLEKEREERKQFALTSEDHRNRLQEQFDSLNNLHQLLAKQEKDQSETLEQLRQERAELIQKLEASQRKLQRSANQRANAARSASSSTTTTTTSTTTPAPQRTNIFETEQFRKINDLVKDIETGAAIFDLRNFMRKTDEIFNP